MSDFKAKMQCTKFDFRWGSAPDLAVGACSAPQTPYLYSRGTISKGKAKREGRGMEREGEKELGIGEGRITPRVG